MKNYIEQVSHSLTAPEDKRPWMLKTHLDYNSKKKSFYKQMLADYFDACNVEYYYKYPIWIPEEKKIFFVDFYLPEYPLMVDIEPIWESQSNDDKKSEDRKLLLSGIKGIGYHIVSGWDLKSNNYRDKIRAMILSGMEYR